MKNSTYLLIFLASFLLTSFSCRKNKESFENELAKLPAISQTGANTFGCLINGKALIPKGYTGNKPNFYVIADPGFMGNLDIRVYNFSNNIKESFSFSCFGIIAAGIYFFPGQTKVYPVYKNESTNCYFISDSSNHAKGFIKINRYDAQNGIVSGEFEYTLFDKTTVCDTLKITNGRFDYKL